CANFPIGCIHIVNPRRRRGWVMRFAGYSPCFIRLFWISPAYSPRHFVFFAKNLLTGVESSRKLGQLYSWFEVGSPALASTHKPDGHNPGSRRCAGSYPLRSLSPG